MSWCDKLASAPTMGFKFDPLATASDAYIQAWSPIMSRHFEGDTPQFTVEVPDPLAFSFTTNEGFKYSADNVRIVVSFQHRMRVRPVSGGSPVMEMMSKALPYTQLLEQVAEQLCEATLALPQSSKRKLKRVGVISATQVAEEDLPPGIARFIEYVGRPWTGRPENMATSITAKLRETSGEVDKCIHIVKIPDDPKELMTVQFDWYREFKTDRAVTTEALKAVTGEARKASLAYFEELAEGSRFDESLLGKHKSA